MLEQYNRKRDFTVTAEPRSGPTGAGPQGGGEGLKFVVQKHNASHLHYDFRLESEGVLKSWAVPKGPSVDPRQRRLAVQVEDHPLEYANFEGTIPQGQYGAGQVIVWDSGTYEPVAQIGPLKGQAAESAIHKGLADGKLSFILSGARLQGEWTLVRIAGSESEWLLIKKRDAFANSEMDVLDDEASTPANRSLASMLDKSEMSPMLAKAADAPFDDPDWTFEPKLDGMRLIAAIDSSGNVSLQSRTSKNAANRFPALCRSLETSQDRGVVFDGEVIATDASGTPSFQELQQRINLSRRADIESADSSSPVVYYVFDILFANGNDLRKTPLRERRRILEAELHETDLVRLITSTVGDGIATYAASIKNGFEGVVAKRLDSVYESGVRSGSWLKVKAGLSGEYVVGGFTSGLGRRADTFGSLLLGKYDEEKKLQFSGHVGTGFTDRQLIILRKQLQSLETRQCPFASEPAVNAASHWVKPILTAEIKFASLTADHQLRHPVFMRLRDDKPAAQSVIPQMKQTATAPTSTGMTESAVEAIDLLRAAPDQADLNIESGNIHVTSLNKELWPESRNNRAITKRDLLIYLLEMSPYLLRQLKDRPITLSRYPDGMSGKHFFQRHWAHKLPDFVNTVTAYSEDTESDSEYILCRNAATLAWLGQLANLEIHCWLSTIETNDSGRQLSAKFAGSAENIAASALNYPDLIAFDLDPYIYSGNEGAGEEPEFNRSAFQKTCEIARLLRTQIQDIGLVPFLKTTGKTGLHIYVPITRKFTFEATRAACETICRYTLNERSTEVTLDWSTAQRRGKIFLDYNMNARSKTLASAYSPRAAAGAGVSLPIAWEELDDISPGQFNILTVPERVKDVGDLWANLYQHKSDLIPGASL